MLGVEVLTCAGRTPVAADEGKNVSEVPAVPVVEEGGVAEGVGVGPRGNVFLVDFMGGEARRDGERLGLLLAPRRGAARRRRRRHDGRHQKELWKCFKN